MKRRSFIKSLGLMGSSVLIPSMYGQSAFSTAMAATRARSALTDQVIFELPAVMPQIINVFLYGGPSELAGNLTNMADINAQSKNKYPTTLLPGGPQHTPNGFWKSAGGDEMERMLASKRMSIYRTINRVDDDSGSHVPSTFSNLTGMIGEDDLRPGIGTNIATFLSANNAITEASTFPLATFDGESVLFNQSDGLLLPHKALSLNASFSNPYKRGQNTALTDGEAALEALVGTMTEGNETRFGKINSIFAKRDETDTYVGVLQDTVLNAPALPNPDFVDGSTQLNERNADITYLTDPLSQTLKAAVGLVIENPETLFVSIGSSGLDEWDDHGSAIVSGTNNSITSKYAVRMRNLMRALETAAQNLEAAGKGNVVINVYGEFGRNANLNDSLGWDHGNCQNLYTVGANPDAAGVTGGLPGRVLGKIVGETTVTGDASVNRLYTTPTATSYQCEPFAIAASVYKYFGVQNPEILTGGYSPIDEVGTENLWVDPNA